MREVLEHDPALYWGIGFALFCTLGAITITLINARRRVRRREGIRQWSMQNGYDYRRELMSANELAPMTHLQTEVRGRGASADNVSRRSSLTIFDLHRPEPTQTGSQRRASHATCALFAVDKALPKFSFTAFTAEPKLEGLFEMMRQMSVDLLPIEERPGFFLRGENYGRLAPFFAGEPGRFFDDKIGWRVEGEKSWLLVQYPRLAREDEYNAFLRVAQSIHDHFAQE